MAAETLVLSPVPQKADHTCSLPTSPAAPSEPDLSACRPFWYDVDHEATQDLREALGCKTPMKTLPDWMPAFETRSLSSASTCAVSPPPQSISPPSSPDRTFVHADLSNGMESPILDQRSPCSPDQQTPCSHGANDKSSWLQARKVFVGGIPQAIDQNAFYQMFSKYGKVKKAWLQLFHSDRKAGQDQAGKKHRGFGFVVFYEKHSIDQLLGPDFSRFIPFGEGDDLKLEVKRAVGKNAPTPSPKEQSAEMQKLQVEPDSNEHLRKPNTSPQMPSALATAAPTTTAEQTSTSQVWQSASPTAPQMWQGAPTQPVIVGVAYVSLPLVPPFPSLQQPMPPIVQWPVSNNHAQLSTPAFQMVQSEQTATPLPACSNVLLGGFLGQKPQNCEELKKALIAAMPDHYDD